MVSCKYLNARTQKYKDTFKERLYAECVAWNFIEFQTPLSLTWTRCFRNQNWALPRSVNNEARPSLIIRLFQLVFSAGTVFFSHNKSAGTVFQLVFSAKWTGPYSGSLVHLRDTFSVLDGYLSLCLYPYLYQYLYLFRSLYLYLIYSPSTLEYSYVSCLKFCQKYNYFLVSRELKWRTD